jgi:hypothetical protein
MSARRTGSTTRLAWAAALVLLADHAGGAAGAAPPPTEVEVKAAFLYHFAQLVTWPETLGGPETPPIVITVLGPDPFGDRLEAMAAQEMVRGRPLVVHRAAKLSDLTHDPHILFVALRDQAEVDRALDSVQKSPVLTVGDATGFAERGGMIGFRLTGDSRVAFDINLKAVQAAGLRMSSQLLKIARVVEPK